MPSPTGKSTVETVQGLLFMCCGVRGNAEVCVVRCRIHSLCLEFGIDSIDNPFLHERIFRLGLLDPHESPVLSKLATRRNAQSTPGLTIRMVLPRMFWLQNQCPKVTKKGTGHSGVTKG